MYRIPKGRETCESNQPLTYHTAVVDVARYVDQRIPRQVVEVAREHLEHVLSTKDVAGIEFVSGQGNGQENVYIGH